MDRHNKLKYHSNRNDAEQNVGPRYRKCSKGTKEDLRKRERETERQTDRQRETERERELELKLFIAHRP